MNTINKNIIVVLPTYNEKDNITKILPAILRQQYFLKRYNLSVLVVDDFSPDGTGKIVKKLSQSNSSIKLITGKKEGLGAAYVRGFTHAINHLDADILIEIDADFSHDPNVIPRLISEIEEGYDFVIGSRYIEGGELAEEWSYARRINSKIGNLVARYITGLTAIQDCTSGYRAIRVKALKKISIKKLNSKGYVFQVSLLFEMCKAGAKVKEIPIHFKDRVHGKSKMSIRDINEFLLLTISLRFKEIFS